MVIIWIYNKRRFFLGEFTLDYLLERLYNMRTESNWATQQQPKKKVGIYSAILSRREKNPFVYTTYLA